MYYSNKIKERLRNVDKDLTWILLENFQSLVEDTISCIPDHISLENEKFYQGQSGKYRSSKVIICSYTPRQILGEPFCLVRTNWQCSLPIALNVVLLHDISELFREVRDGSCLCVGNKIDNELASYFLMHNVFIFQD